MHARIGARRVDRGGPVKWCYGDAVPDLGHRGMRACLLAACLVAACRGRQPYEPVRQAASTGPPTTALAPAPPADQATPPKVPSSADFVFVDVAAFEALRDRGATVLDARKSAAYAAGHIPNAQHAPWERFVSGERSGRLSADLSALGRGVAAVGVADDRTVLVYGDWDAAWGEEGRIFWMLEYLGHPDVHILAGGVRAYQAAGHPLTAEVSAPRPATFTPSPRAGRRATADDVERALAAQDAVVLDIRSRAEYEGAAPYGSTRGGHIPTAIHFHWRELFDPSGALLAPTAVRTRLEALGVATATPVIAYCTGGIRSGFVYAVMRSAGYLRPRNYDGSWWEWSQRPDATIDHR